ncbi:serine/threonine-protein kinase [Cohnella fermenti]|uniref:Serine/threonine protein kinase n=1 Tax=Cohnella fermenti TaxID=2565925 RepID=A0A4S4BJ60_9BACL|nr:serine/threonine-protein kinase [Cohnella fermenti]THF74579.1 serine/threonine protein kinase [Cohnella fermenti]
MEIRQERPFAGLPAAGELFAERYRVRMPIGRGGMGSVLLAEDERLGGKLRALKFVGPLPGEESPAEERFLAEARLLSRLQHPNLPQIVDYYRPDGGLPACIVMDYIAGESLQQRWLNQGLRLPFAEIVHYLIELCDVLRYLHAQRPPIVFRDLKPANVMIDRQGRAILVDFGIARTYRESAASDTMRLGTPGFASPEQLRGLQSDERTDLYGLGALAYYLLSGGELASRGYRPDACREDVPRRFRDLLSRLLAPLPTDRPGSAQLLYRELQGLAAGSGGAGGTMREEKRGAAEGGEAKPARAGRGGGPELVAVVSAYPGAGATYVALALSARLTALGAPHSVAECPGGEPELFAWLDGERRKPPRCAYCDPAGMLPAAPAWKRGRAACYPLDPEDGSRRPPEAAFAAWLRRLDGRIVLLDVSSRWEHPAVEDWVARHADRILFVADSLPLRWSGRRQQAALRLMEAARSRGAETGWLANRDYPFAGRDEWLGMLPEAPLLSIPLVPYAEAASRLWSGELPSIGGAAEAACDRLLERLWENRPMR